MQIILDEIVSTKARTYAEITFFIKNYPTFRTLLYVTFAIMMTLTTSIGCASIMPLVTGITFYN